MTDTMNAAASEAEQKHTPGTWTNKEHSTYVWSEHGNVCACGDPHASGFVGYTECGPGSQFLGEAIANARMISAAPDLYSAILNSDDAHWTPAMRAAMAKAEGR